MYLKVRTYKLLKSKEINTIGDLMTQSAFDLLLIPGFGRGSLEEVEQALAAYGFALAKSKDDWRLRVEIKSESEIK